MEKVCSDLNTKLKSDLLGVAAACRESFRVLTFGTSFMTQPTADIFTAKARHATHGLFSKKSHPITCCDAQ